MKLRILTGVMWGAVGVAVFLVVVWVRSYWVFDQVMMGWPEGTQVSVVRGEVAVKAWRHPGVRWWSQGSWSWYSSKVASEFKAGFEPFNASMQRWSYEVMGVRVAKFVVEAPADPAPPASTVWYVRMPVWVLMVSAGAWVAVVFWMRRRAGLRVVPGVCGKCGYDLRAHGAGGKCPECGTVIPTPTKVASNRVASN